MTVSTASLPEKPAGAGARPFVAIEDVHKSYRLGDTTIHAIRGVTLALHPGEFTALVGPSGSGKSTLLNLAGALDTPDQGRVVIDGHDVAALDDNRRSRLRNARIGFVFQSFNLVPVLNVLENVELPLLAGDAGRPAARRERVMQALSDVGLADYARHLPDRLSGGQRQRVAIARALVTEPLLIIADEPTANLDSGTTHRIIDLLLDLNARRGATFLFSTHDEKLMSRVTRILRLVDGVLA
ncbi:MAG: ABC transporter ATP-binding protein [Deltaproteobacteria bacterium]|nr:ABC transporter ATP-binding protein [Deltaproteobacteria bacterium]